MRRGRNLGIIAPPPASATAPEVMPRCRAGAGRVPLALACGNGMRDRPCRPGAWLATRWPWHLTAPGRGAGPPQCRAWRAVRRETPFLRRLQVECNGLAGGVPPRHSVCFATGSPFCSRLVPTTRFRPRDMAAGHLLWGDAMGGGLLKGSWASRRDLGLARLARLGRHGARMWSANGLARRAAATPPGFAVSRAGGFTYHRWRRWIVATVRIKWTDEVRHRSTVVMGRRGSRTARLGALRRSHGPHQVDG